MSSGDSTRHKRREAKAARRSRRIETGRRPRRVDMKALSDKGAERMQHALSTLPKGFGKSKKSESESADAQTLFERIFGRVAA